MSTVVSNNYGAVLSETNLALKGLLRNRKCIVRDHEQGFVIAAGNQTDSIRYQDVEQFSWQTTCITVNGNAAGRTCALRIWHSAGGPESQEFSFFQNPVWKQSEKCFGLPIGRFVPLNGRKFNPTSDSTLESIRVTLTESVVQKMLAKLNAGQPVTWTAKAQLSRDGIQLSATKRRQVTSFGYHQIRDACLNNSKLTIHTSFPEIPNLVLEAGDVNFYPGLQLLKQLMAGR